MFFDIPDDSKAEVTLPKAVQHLLVFQVKLVSDALRDLLLSPISLIVFALDVVRKPTLENSIYLKLMLLGRRSDRLINLFDEHKDAGHFTVDQALEELESLVLRAHEASTQSRK